MRILPSLLLASLSLLGSASLCAPKPESPAPQPKAADVLLRWVEGRWQLADPKTGTVPPLKEGRVLCSITAEQIQKSEGAKKLAEVREALDKLFALRDQRLISPIFRVVDPSRELLAYVQGQEFIVEKFFESRDSIAVPPAMPQKSSLPKPDAFDLVRDLAGDPRYCALNP